MTEKQIAQAMEDAKEPGRVVREFVTYAGEHVQVRAVQDGPILVHMRGGDEELEFFFALELRPNEARDLAHALVRAYDDATLWVKP